MPTHRVRGEWVAGSGLTKGRVALGCALTSGALVSVVASAGAARGDQRGFADRSWARGGVGMHESSAAYGPKAGLICPAMSAAPMLLSVIGTSSRGSNLNARSGASESVRFATDIVLVVTFDCA